MLSTFVLGQLEGLSLDTPDLEFGDQNVRVHGEWCGHDDETVSEQ